MTDAPLFSVITVVLNDREGFAATAESVAAQRNSSGARIEFVVIDGVSTDGTLDEIRNRGGEIDLSVSEPDRGLYDAMNKGLERSSGQYVIFMNAGDTFAQNDTLGRVAKSILEARFPDFVYGDALERTGTGESLLKRARSHKRVWYGMFTHHQAMLYKRNALGSIRYRLEYGIGADYALTAEFLSRAAGVLYLPFALCVFELGGLSSRSLVRGMREQWRIRRDVMGMSFLFRLYILALHASIHLVKGCCPVIYRKLRFS